MAKPLINFDFETITLQVDPRGNYVTWAGGKKQIRAALKTVNWTAVSSFRPRKENKEEFSIQARNAKGTLHVVTCDCEPGALIKVTRQEISQK